MTEVSARQQHIQIMRAPLQELRTGYYCILCGRELIYTHYMSEDEQERRIERYEEYMVNVEGDIDALHYVYIWGCVEHGMVHEHCDVVLHLRQNDEMPHLSKEAPYHVIPSSIACENPSSTSSLSEQL